MAPAATSRLATVFAELRRRGERALVAYLTAGDPSLADTRRLVREAAARGADIVELGVPFSDPIADGPVIQRAAMRALARGTSVARVLETVATLRAETAVPLVLLTYYNPVLAFGLKAFAQTAADAGVDGGTGARRPPDQAAAAQIRALRRLTTKAVCVGFGIAHPDQVEAVGRLADGVIVGSAIVRLIEERADSPTLVQDVGDFIAALKEPLRVRL